ncbi:hypothetical protein EAS64_21405 [Trebonia kvetii]|uniref:Uncharacterized protein n=1 Tax=Trebonia kvetii TaxID=2480626 RepID=A0A6P2BVR4_9ACTN|nr:hypothetical protein [Trebonia kvetii]TVZ03018.1 hypothetical protein EAS64_21405 [Trebonia kvetii]
MSDTVLEHLLVRSYLHELSAACVTLPAAQARELREQITAHLDEALPPDATDAEVRAELTRLGRPRSLAAEVAGPGWQPIARRLRNWLGHVRWWVWAALAILVAALGTWAGFLDSMNSAAPLHVSGTGWLYPVDQQRAIDTTAAGANQTTVPVRSGQRQGITLAVWNNSDWTQEILGTDPLWYYAEFTDVQVDVESGPHLNQVGEPYNSARFLSPGVIPPHSYRFVRVTWTSNICLVGNGTETWFGDIPLQVRVGVITRTEDVRLAGENFALAGPSSGRCS